MSQLEAAGVWSPESWPRHLHLNSEPWALLQGGIGTTRCSPGPPLSPSCPATGGPVAVSLLWAWCRGLDGDVHRAPLVTGIPRGQAASEAVLQPAFLALGACRLRNTRAVRNEEAEAALVEPVEDVNRAAIPREILGQAGVWKVLCKDCRGQS